MLANMIMKNPDVRVERIAAYGVDGIHKALQIQLDSTALP
jgi:hypothetical protein